MKFDIDEGEREVSFTAPVKNYGEEGVRIAAHVFGRRAEVFAARERGEWSLTLKARRRNTKKCDLEALGGDFLNELLNQEYRFIVTRHNRKISELVATQVLFAARGGKEPPKPLKETPEFKKEVSALMEETREEIARTMPKKIAPKGIPMSLPKEEESA